MTTYQPYPIRNAFVVKALYHALRQGVLSRALWAACMHFSIMGQWIDGDPGRA